MCACLCPYTGQSLPASVTLGDVQGEGEAIQAAEAACAEAEAAEAVAGAAKAALDQARVAVVAIDTAIAACAGSGISKQLIHARAEAEAALQVPSSPFCPACRAADVSPRDHCVLQRWADAG